MLIAFPTVVGTVCVALMQQKRILDCILGLSLIRMTSVY